MKTCVNHHPYEEHLDECPHCPDKTVIENATSIPTDSEDNNSDKTAVSSVQSTSGDKTSILQSSKSDSPISDRTIIHKTETKSSESSATGSENGRKLVGWLVSFTWKSDGQDYKLREGKTLIGSDNKCDIVVNDNEVSGHHTTILYRGGTFKIKDEFSTNGTRIDGKEIEDQAELEDGNTITIGKTDFLFRRI